MMISAFISNITTGSNLSGFRRSARRSSLSSIKKRLSSSSSERSEDFVSCCSDLSPNVVDSESIEDCSFTLEDIDTVNTEMKKVRNISKKVIEPVKTSLEEPVPTTAAETSPLENDKSFSKDEVKFDLSQNIYDGVKSVWGYGCDIPVVKPILKVSEGVAGKALNLITGIDLEKGDEEIKPKLAEMDEDILNPAVSKLISILEPLVVKVDDSVRPIVVGIIQMNYLKMLKKDSPNPEEAVPEDTSKVPIQ